MSFYTNVHAWGNDLLYNGYDKKGERIQKRIPFEPELFVRANSEAETESHCYDDTPLRAVQFDSIKEAKEYVKLYSNCEGTTLYGQDKFPYQFINRAFEEDVPYDMEVLRVQYFDIEVRSDQGFPEPMAALREITCMSLKDLKTNTMHVWINDNPINGGKFDPDNLQYIDKSDITFDIVVHSFATEKEMLRDFGAWFTLNPPDILSGWYSKHFDIPYIYNRIKNVLGSKCANNLSPWGKVREQTKQVRQFGALKEETTYNIYGVADLDYQVLYKKYSPSKSPSYKLDVITQKHLKKGKLQFDGTLHDLLTTNFQKYVEYNIIDVERIHQLDNSLKFMDLIVDVAYSGKVANFEDALGTVKYWEMLVYSHLVSKGQQPPLKKFSGAGVKNDQYAGAFVKNPQVGLHKWIVSFDLASLYPSIIRQVNIGPETKIDLSTIPSETVKKLKALPVVTYAATGNDTVNDAYINKTADLSFLTAGNNDYSLSGNSKLYSKARQSFLSELMEKFFNKRKVYKKLMFEAEQLYLDTGEERYKKDQIIYGVKQLATKILINSAYGAVGNQYFQYYDLDNAEAVTITGQLVIRWIEQRMNKYLNDLFTDEKEKARIVYMDTDSMYITLDDLVQRILPGETDQTKIVNFLDKVCKNKLEPFINECYDELFKYLNNYQSHMVMDREAISDKAIWTGKKRYFMNVQDNEGARYDPPKFKVLGIEVVKSSTPMVCREKLEVGLKLMLNGSEDDLIDFIEGFKKEFKSLAPAQVAFPRGVNAISKWLDSQGKIKSGCPIHVRGTINHNKQLEANNLTNDYDLIREGDSVLFTYMRKPNHIHSHVFAFIGEIPKELNLVKFVDYDLQFEKTFLEPLKAIADIIGWQTERTNSLASLFG